MAARRLVVGGWQLSPVFLTVRALQYKPRDLALALPRKKCCPSLLERFGNVENGGTLWMARCHPWYVVIPCRDEFTKRDLIYEVSNVQWYSIVVLVIITMVMTLLCARCFLKCLSEIISFNPHKNSRRQEMCFLFYRSGNKLREVELLAQITQLT